MEETLAHFPTLEVLVEEVDEDEVVETVPVAKDPRRHMMFEPGATVTACGLPTSDVSIVSVREYFNAGDGACPACFAVAGG